MADKANMVIMAAADNVGIALRDISAGSSAFDKQGVQLIAAEAIPQGHKIALTAIAAEQTIIRFSMPVAKATQAIATGQLVHIHNVESQYLNNDYDHYE